jgi:hypothetical protein
MADEFTDPVWRIKSKVGGGWLRDLHDGEPIVTGIVEEARQFDDPAEAARIVKTLNARRHLVPSEMVQGERSTAFSHGAP